MNWPRWSGSAEANLRRIQSVLLGLGLVPAGLAALAFPDYWREIITALSLPLVIGFASIRRITFIYRDKPAKLTGFMALSFGIKMVLYAIFILIIFTFSAFNARAFILSFLGFFCVFHTVEALYLTRLFKPNQTKPDY